MIYEKIHMVGNLYAKKHILPCFVFIDRSI